MYIRPPRDFRTKTKRQMWKETVVQVQQLALPVARPLIRERVEAMLEFRKWARRMKEQPLTDSLSIQFFKAMKRIRRAEFHLFVPDAPDKQQRLGLIHYLCRRWTWLEARECFPAKNATARHVS